MERFMVIHFSLSMGSICLVGSDGFTGLRMGRSRVVDDPRFLRSAVANLPLFRNVLISYYHLTSAASVKTAARDPTLRPGPGQKPKHP